jgi:hypothetical protein
MRQLTKWAALAAASLLAGCTGTLTNLSPNYQTRRADGLYPVSVAFDSQQQSLRWDSIKPFVLVGSEEYPMRPTPLMTNRWEALVPAAPGVDEVEYRYKLEWQYNAIPNPQNDSQLSKKQVLHIINPQ